MIGLARLGKSLLSAATAAAKYSKAKAGSLYWYRKIPFKSVTPVLTNPKMSRKQFLRRSGKILSETRVQANMANATAGMKKDQLKANYFLTSPSTKKKLRTLKPKDLKIISQEFTKNPFRPGSFRHRVFDNFRVSKHGHPDSGGDVLMKSEKMLSGKMKPKTNLEKVWYYRDLMSKHYGHRQGTGSYSHIAFEIPKTDVYHGSGLIDYVGRLSAKMNKGVNPLLQAFREGRWG